VRGHRYLIGVPRRSSASETADDTARCDPNSIRWQVHRRELRRAGTSLCRLMVLAGQRVAAINSHQPAGTNGPGVGTLTACGSAAWGRLFGYSVIGVFVPRCRV
jgi:hypothetical protein